MIDTAAGPAAVQVHYRGWKNKWGERVTLDSGRIQLAKGQEAVAVAAIKPRRGWDVGDHVQAFMGKTGPYATVVTGVYGSSPSDREYTLDWEDGDPNGRRQPTTNVMHCI